jgi:hypothetical protein
MHADEIRHLFEYEHWVTSRILASPRTSQLPTLSATSQRLRAAVVSARRSEQEPEQSA